MANSLITRRQFAASLGGLALLRKPFHRDMDKPNIVFIFADDLGYGDLGCYNPNSKIPSPNVDRLAREGMRFTDAHTASAVCTPSRYGLLTGRYCWRTRLQYFVLNPYDPPLIEEGRLTLPGLLRRHGYHTACIGKWHLGWDWPMRDGKPDFTQRIAAGPITRGFDHYFGTDVPNYPPYCFIENNRTVGLPTAWKKTDNLDGRPGPMAPNWKFEEILPKLVDVSVRYIGQRAAAKQPFFLYLPLTSPHEPVQPSARFRGKSGINPVADFMIETDWAVGEILAALNRYKCSDNTLVIFTADNGHAAYTGLPELLKHGHDPSTPLRGYKASIYEGGHREPFVARWPGKIKPGSTSDQLMCLTDMVGTCAEILNVKLPDNAAEDSYSMLPALLGQRSRHHVRQAIVNHSGSGRFAIRQGEWKLILEETSFPGYHDEPKHEELFNLGEDLGEKKDVYGQHPERVAQLTRLLNKYKAEGRSRPRGVWP